VNPLSPHKDVMQPQPNWPTILAPLDASWASEDFSHSN